MGFTPFTEKHAIQEVAFVLTFARPFSTANMEALTKAHDAISGELPRLERGTVIQFDFVGHDQREAPPPPVSIQSYKRDGSLDWRVFASDNYIAVNCLSYSRWDLVYKQARRYLNWARSTLSNLNVSGFGLQYIDTFRYNGDVSEYSAFDLIRRDSGLVPGKFDPRSPFWHLHVGHRSACEAIKGNLLRRLHMDAMEVDQEFVVRIDSTYLFELVPAMPGGWAYIDGVQDESFRMAHDLNKQDLREVLIPEMVLSISLDGGDGE